MDLINNECGGLKPGRKLKAVIPGGSSAPVLTADEAMKANMDYESLAGLGSMLGSGAIIVMDDSNSMVDMLDVILHFYHHESCGQCTPCREGTGWLNKVMHRIAHGHGESKDIDLIKAIAEHMMGKTICALSDAAAMPAISFVTKFRDEFEQHLKHGAHGKVEGVAHA
jgi:NADH-quinone oxidoreductase subunit F